MVYSFILLFLIFCVYIYDIKNHTSGKNISYFILFVLFVGMVSLRFRVGGDALFYEDYYPEIPTLSDLPSFLSYDNNYFFQPGWVFFCAISKTISENIILFQVLHSILINILFFIFVKRYSTKIFTVFLLLFISLLYFYYSFEIQRESIAVGFFLINIKNLEEKKWVNYYLLATISFMFHISALILFILPAFRLIKFNRKFVIIMIIIGALISIFREKFLEIFSSLLFLESMKYKGDVYSVNNFSLIGFLSYYFVRVILVIPLFLYQYYEKKENLKYNWFYSSFFMISVMAQYFVGFERFLNYLFPLYFIVIVDFISFNVPKIRLGILKHFIVITMFLHVFFILDYKLFIKTEYGQHYYSIFFPYNSQLDPQINYEREAFYYDQW